MGGVPDIFSERQHTRYEELVEQYPQDRWRAIMSQSKWDEKNLQKSLCKTIMKIGIVRSAKRREKQQKQILNRCGQKEWSHELMSKKEADQNSLFFYDIKISMCIFYL